MSSATHIKNEFGWSWTRNQMFRQCARKLYWQYYGSWGGWQSDAPADAQLAYRLKRLQGLAMLVGSTFHDALAFRLRAHSAPEEVPVGKLYLDMERRLRNALRQSADRDWEGGENRTTILFEDYYGLGVDDAARQRAFDDLKASVEGLGRHPYARRVFQKARETLRWIDPSTAAETKVPYDDLLLFASPDLVVEAEDGSFHIIDWKTGKPGELNLSQMAVYGLFVREKFGAELNRMSASVIYVRTGNHKTHVNLEHGAAEAHRLIRTFVNDVRSRLTDVPNNIAGDIDRFPMTTDLRLCCSCNFRRLCNRMDGSPQAPAEE